MMDYSDASNVDLEVLDLEMKTNFTSVSASLDEFLIFSWAKTNLQLGASPLISSLKSLLEQTGKRRRSR
jgi:hypothetical protein